LTMDEVASGMTIDDKLNTMCYKYQVWDRLFGDRQNYAPSHLMEAGVDDVQLDLSGDTEAVEEDPSDPSAADNEKDTEEAVGDNDEEDIGELHDNDEKQDDPKPDEPNNVSDLTEDTPLDKHKKKAAALP
jgi:hypothetical protein